MKEPNAETAVGPVGWVQDQVYQLKGQVAQLEQQLEQLQSMATKMTESMHAIETSLRRVTAEAAPVPRLQEELNQSIALIVQLQDQHAEAKERLGELGRRREEEQSQDQQDWVEVARRVEQLERQIASWQDRQAGVDEVGRRFQEENSLLRQQLQEQEQRLEGAETKSARSLEGANRAEQKLTQVDAALLSLRQEGEAAAERSKVMADMAHRLERTLEHSQKELQRLELLAERIELHRAERQRLEDRALRLEEELEELRGHSDKQQERVVRLSAQQQSVASNYETLQEQVTDQRTLLAEQLRKLTAVQERTKRRQIQEMEREIREMKRHVAELTDQ